MISRIFATLGLLIAMICVFCEENHLAWPFFALAVLFTWYDGKIVRKSLAGRTLTVAQKAAFKAAFRKCSAQIIAVRICSADAECIRYTKEVAKAILDCHDWVEVTGAEKVSPSSEINIHTHPDRRVLAEAFAKILGTTLINEGVFGPYDLMIDIHSKPIL